MKYLQKGGGTVFDIFKYSESDVVQSVYQDMTTCPSRDGCMSMARDDNFVFISWRYYLKDRISVG